MNSDYEHQLERAIDRELRGLPPVTAPSTLTARILAAIAQTAALPWYRRSWLSWSPGVRMTCFTILAVVFAGICLAAWQFPHSGVGSYCLAKGQGMLSVAATFLNAIHVLLGAIGMAVRQMGSVFLFGCVAAVIMGYLLCIGLGTVTLRLAWSRR